jgi:nitrate reductase (NAD(P)H)
VGPPARRGRIDAEFLGQWARPGQGRVALVCGPEAMERSVKEALGGMGWAEEDLVFF